MNSVIKDLAWFVIWLGVNGVGCVRAYTAWTDGDPDGLHRTISFLAFALGAVIARAATLDKGDDHGQA